MSANFSRPRVHRIRYGFPGVAGVQGLYQIIELNVTPRLFDEPFLKVFDEKNNWRR